MLPPPAAHPLHPTPPDPTRVFNSSSSLLLGQPSLLKHFHPAALFYFCPATVKTAGGSSQVTLFADPARGGEWWWGVVVVGGGGGTEVGPRIFFFFGPFMGEGSRIFFVFPSLWFVAKKRKQGKKKEKGTRETGGGAFLWSGSHCCGYDVIG